MRRPRPQQLNRLWIARKQAGLGQKTVAKLLGYKSTSAISEYEHGRLLPSLRTAFKLSILYNTPLSGLYAPLYDDVQQELGFIRQRNPARANLGSGVPSI